MNPSPFATFGPRVARSWALPLLFLSCAASLQAGAPVPLLHLRFDEGAGKAVADTGEMSDENGVREENVLATLRGDAAWTTDTPAGNGAALSLSGKDGSYVSMPGRKVHGLVQFTITLWVNFRAVPTINDRLLSSLKAREGIDLRVSNFNQDTGHVALALDVNDGIAHGSAGINAVGGWVFVAITFDGTSTENNVRYFTAEPGRPVLPAGRGSSDGGEVRGRAELQIGSTPSNPTRTPTAWIDDLRVYPGLLDLRTLEGIAR